MRVMRIVNVIPELYTNEQAFDFEPSIAVNPRNERNIIVTFLANTGFGTYGAQNGTGSPTDLIKCISSTLNTTANRCNLTTLPTKTAQSSTWSAGIYTAPATTFFFDPPKDATTTADATWGPYDTLNVGITVLDSDGSTLTVPASPTFTLNGDTYRAINATAAKVRYGRMRIQNASGSDQVPLLLPVTA